MNKVAKCIAIAFAVIIVALLAILAFVNPPPKGVATAGHTPVTLGYPTSLDGHVKIFNPIPGQIVVSPSAISGNVTGGGWFFEGTFPVRIVDANGAVLGDGQAKETEPGAWASTGTVAFAGTIFFNVSHSATGTIVFSKDNPSGMPQNSESFSVPVRFR